VPTVQELFDDLQRRIDDHPERSEGLTATYQFVIEGEGGGQWNLKVVDGKAKVGTGPVGDPDTTTTMAAEDFIAMSTGQLDGTTAFMEGKLKVAGDQFKGMRLAQIMAPDEPEDDDDW
jgi:putative sterol carrier protein